MILRKCVEFQLYQSDFFRKPLLSGYGEPEKRLRNIETTQQYGSLHQTHANMESQRRGSEEKNNGTGYIGQITCLCTILMP